MKHKTLKIAIVLAMVFLITGILYAANGDRIVNGNPEVGSPAPDGNAEIKGHMNSDRYFGGDTAKPGGKAEISDNRAADSNPGVGTNTPEEKIKAVGSN